MEIAPHRPPVRGRVNSDRMCREFCPSRPRRGEPARAGGRGSACHGLRRLLGAGGVPGPWTVDAGRRFILV